MLRLPTQEVETLAPAYLQNARGRYLRDLSHDNQLHLGKSLDELHNLARQSHLPQPGVSNARRLTLHTCLTTQLDVLPLQVPSAIQRKSMCPLPDALDAVDLHNSGNS